jgi:hypothetical protein
MKKELYKLNLEKIVALMLLFILSSGSLFIFTIYNNLGSIVKQVLFYFGFLGYGSILIIILLYYISKINTWLNKDEFRMVVSVAIVLAVCHSSLIGLDNSSWFAFLGYLAGDGLVIFLGTFGYKKWQKNKKQNLNKLK